MIHFGPEICHNLGDFSKILRPHVEDGRIRIFHIGSSEWRVRRALTACMARLLSATPCYCSGIPGSSSEFIPLYGIMRL